MKSNLPAETALIGRDHEIKQLIQHLDSAVNGKGTTVFICGEAGIGKTRLVNEFLNLARKAGTKVLKGWCLSEAALPYFPFAEAFNAYISTMSDEKAKSAMTKELGITGWLKGPEYARELEVPQVFSAPKIERDRTFEAAAKVLFQQSAKETLILFLDDLHWADHLSLALLHYLARKCRNSRLLIIGTYRPEEIIPTEGRRLHPLEEAMFSMSREDLIVRKELSRLKRNDFPELLISIFRSLIDEEFVEDLYEETEGNPLFALETLNLLVDEGILLEKQGQWILTAPREKIRIPSKVHEVITRRIARLQREERTLVDLAAVSGHSFTPEILSRTLGSDIADVVRTLVELQQRHRLISSLDSTYEFTHHKIREVVYSNMPGELRRIYHLKIAGCLEQIPAEKISDGYTADLAFHYVEGGAPERAFEYLVKLGEKAVRISANMQAIDHLSKALEATKKETSLASKENLAKIYRLRGEAWLGQGEAPKAINDFNLLLENAASIGDESMIAEAHYWTVRCHAYTGDSDKAMPHITKTLQLARKTGNKLIEGRSLAELALPLLGSLDNLEEGRMRLDESLKISEETSDKFLKARNLYFLGLYHNWKGEFDRAKEITSEALTLFEELGDNLNRIAAASLLGIVLGGKGEYSDAISTLQRCLQLCQDWGIVAYVPRILNVLGWIYHDLGNIELSLESNSEGLEFARKHEESMGVATVQPACLVNLGMDYLRQNDYESARKHFQDANSLIHLHPLARWRFETRILLGLGEISLWKHEYAQALRCVEDSLRISEKAGAKKYIAKGLKLRAEVLEKMGNIEEAIELMEKALRLAQQVGNPPTLWQIHHSLGLLLEKSGNPQKANEHHASAIALIETSASKLRDISFTNSLLAAPLTRAIRDAYAKTKPAS